MNSSILLSIPYEFHLFSALFSPTDAAIHICNEMKRPDLVNIVDEHVRPLHDPWYSTHAVLLLRTIGAHAQNPNRLPIVSMGEAQNIVAATLEDLRRLDVENVQIYVLPMTEAVILSVS